MMTRAVTGEQLDLPKVKVATIARRPATDAELSDATCTPDWLTALLPTVDIDPCSNERSTVRAKRTYRLERKQDGLSLPWHGTAFDNNPFSEPLPWMEKAITELRSGRCTDLIVLCKHDEGTEWWDVINQPIERILNGRPVQLRPEKWTFHKRVQYKEHPELIERRRLEQRQKMIAKGKNPDHPDGRPKAAASGKSQTNFTSVILHHRGVYPNGQRRPRLVKLTSVARLWLPIDDLTTEIY